jgi:hypothetical protein
LSGDGGTKKWESAWVDLASRDERPVAWHRSSLIQFDHPGKHQTHLQDYVAEKSGENKKRPAQ